MLVALIACASPRAPEPRSCPQCPEVSRPPARVVETRVIYCGDWRRPEPPAYDKCDGPSDYSPGSCWSINRARRLDYGRLLEQWGEYIDHACGLLEKPAWGTRP